LRNVGAKGQRGLLPRKEKGRGRPLNIAVPSDEPVDERSPYAGVGVELRLARERRDLTREDVSANICVQRQFLEAIEEGRFDDLPGAVYVSGFLKSYAVYLGFDPEHVVRQFRQESTMVLGPTKLVMPAPIAEPRRPRGLVVALSLLAAAVLYGGWAFLQDRIGISVEGVTAAPDRLLTLLRSTEEVTTGPEKAPDTAASTAASATETAADRSEAPTADLVAAGTEVQPGPAVVSTDEPTDAAVTRLEAARDVEAVPPGDESDISGIGPETTVRLAAETPAAVAKAEVAEAAVSEDLPPQSPSLRTLELPRTETAAASPPPPPPATTDLAASVDVLSLRPKPPSATAVDDYVPQHFGGDNQDARVIVRAKVDSWVQVQGPSNELLLTRILRAGDTYYAPNRSDLLLTTGNVGGLEIFVDGEPLGPLGPLGEVRRDISLDAEQLLAMAAARGQ
jgi:cytoskeleton protein RodZ